MFLFAISMILFPNTRSTALAFRPTVSRHMSSTLAHASQQSHSAITDILTTSDNLGQAAGSRTAVPLPLEKPHGIIFDMDGTLTRPCIDFAAMRQSIYDICSNDLGRTITDGCVLEWTDANAGKLSPQAHAQAMTVLHEIEQDAIDDMQVMDGMVELCQWLDTVGIPRALLTRNVERSVDALHHKLLVTSSPSSPSHLGLQLERPFWPAVARNTVDPTNTSATTATRTATSTSTIPAKPQPDAIHYICRQWKCHTSQVIMVGDSLQDDVVAANRAPCSSIHLDHSTSTTVSQHAAAAATSSAAAEEEENEYTRSMHKRQDYDNCSGNASNSKPHERIPTCTVSSLQELQHLLQRHYC